MDTIVYAGRIKDRSVLTSSSSGGAFTALSDAFLNNRNAVLCSGYNYNTHQAEFRLVTTKEERDACKGSMYMQSYALNSWNEAVEWLKKESEKQLIFFGVGCQGASFSRFAEMKKIRDRVTVIDIICHGSPSPLIWKEYVAFLENKGGVISNINFRDKRTGWDRSIGIARQGNKEISLASYRRLYSSRTALRPCCSKCPYTSTERYTDITIGDFWHLEKSLPDFYDEMGTSLFLIHTEKGVSIFENIRDKLDVRESNIVDCWQLNLEKPTEHSEKRDQFWQDFKDKGIEYVVKKYGTVSLLQRIIRKVQKLYNRNK